MENRNTTVSAVTVLFSLQSVFVFIVSSCILKLETPTILKSIGVICGITGTILTTLHDEANADETNDDEYTTDGAILVGDSVAVTTKGDLLAIAAAGFYAMYTIQVRQYCSDNEELYSLPLLLGYIGLVSIVATSPIVLLTTSKEVFLSLTWGTLGLMCIKGTLDFLVSDYLMFRSVILTSPTIASKY
jgi:solute carrier family 35, member F5